MNTKFVTACLNVMPFYGNFKIKLRHWTKLSTYAKCPEKFKILKRWFGFKSWENS